MPGSKTAAVFLAPTPAPSDLLPRQSRNTVFVQTADGSRILWRSAPFQLSAVGTDVTGVRGDAQTTVLLRQKGAKAQ